jgi:hypothetical protein
MIATRRLDRGVPFAHRLDRFGDHPFRLGETVGIPRGVSRPHAGRTIKQENPASCRFPFVDSSWPQQREGGQRDGEQLQEQQQVLAKPLQQAVDVQVFDRLGPQEGAGDGSERPTELEKIEQHDAHGHRRQQRPLPSR